MVPYILDKELLISAIPLCVIEDFKTSIVSIKDTFKYFQGKSSSFHHSEYKTQQEDASKPKTHLAMNFIQQKNDYVLITP